MQEADNQVQRPVQLTSSLKVAGLSPCSDAGMGSIWAVFVLDPHTKISNKQISNWADIQSTNLLDSICSFLQPEEQKSLQDDLQIYPLGIPGTANTAQLL